MHPGLLLEDRANGLPHDFQDSIYGIGEDNRMGKHTGLPRQKTWGKGITNLPGLNKGGGKDEIGLI